MAEAADDEDEDEDEDLLLLLLEEGVLRVLAPNAPRAPPIARLTKVRSGIRLPCSVLHPAAATIPPAAAPTNTRDEEVGCFRLSAAMVPVATPMPHGIITQRMRPAP